MKKRILWALAALALIFALAAGAAAADAPTLEVAANGTVTCSAGEGNTLYLASYDPATGRFLGLLESGAKLPGSIALKAIQTDNAADLRPVSEAKSVLVVAEKGTYTGSAFQSYDEVVILSDVSGAVTLKDMTAGDLTVYSACDLTLDGVTVTGELKVDAGTAGAAAQRLPGSGELLADGMPSIVITSKSGVGSVRVVQTADGGVRLRTEEGCRVTWTFVDDGKGEIILDGTFNQVAVDTANAGVVLDGAEVSGLTINRANANVTLTGETTVTAVEIPAAASGASLTAEEKSKVASVQSDAPDVSISGEGSITRAGVSGDGTTVDTVGTWLSVETGTEGVNQNGSAVAGGASVKTGTVEQGGSGGAHYEPEIHTHRWSEGCTTEATETQAGSVTMVCTVCGITRETATSYQPYQVTLGEGDGAESFRFETIDEAVRFAGQHLIEEKLIPDDENSVIVLYYPEVFVMGNATVQDLTLPKGQALCLGDGGHLTVLGTMSMGSSRWVDETHIYNTGQLFLDLSAGRECSLTLGDQLIYDSADLEQSAIVIDEYSEIGSEGNQHFLCFSGGYSGEPRDFITPELLLSGNSGPASFRIQQDLDLTSFVQGMHIDGADEEREQGNVVVITATLRVPTAEVWGEPGPGCFLLLGGSLITDELSLGFSEECNIQVVPAEGHEQVPAVFLHDANQYSIQGGSLILRGETDWPRGDYGPDQEDPAPQSITIIEGAVVTVQEDQGCWLPENIALNNCGTLILRGELSLNPGCVLTNEGTMIQEAYRSDSPESDREEDNYRFGRLQMNGATFKNQGTLQMDNVKFINSDGDDDARWAELWVRNNGYFYNTGDGQVLCGGFFFAEGGSTVHNEGLMKITEEGAFLELRPGVEQWFIRDGGEPKMDCDNAPCTLVNFGTLENAGSVRLYGTAFDNHGTFVNRDRTEFCSEEDRKEVYTLTRTEGEPENDDDWDCFWGWDWDSDGQAWWKETGCEVTIGEDHRIVQDFFNAEDGVFLNDEGDLWIEGNVRNYGSFTNGVLTGVGEEESGSDAWISQNGGSFDNGGTVVNNGGWNIEDVNYTQYDGAKFTTYNTGGFEVRGGSLTVPSGGWFKNEGYLKLIDRYGGEFAPVDLSGFEDFYTTWNQDDNDSNWCDVTAEVYDFAGYLEAVDAQHARAELNPNTCYNRLDFCGDITITEDVCFEDFRDYWLQNRDEQRWHVWDEEQEEWIEADRDTEGAEDYWVRRGVRLTVAEGATLTIASENVLRVDGWDEEYRTFIPCVLEVKGKLVIQGRQEITDDNDEAVGWLEPGLVEIWRFGSFDASAGTVENNGRFEVRYWEMGTVEETDDGYINIPGGDFARPAECPVLGAPENAENAAEVRSALGFKNAVASEDPAFYRLYLREDCIVTITEDLTVPQEINVEPGSGLIVEHGATLTLNEHLWNDGDISVYGDLVIAQSGDINQHLEIGAMTGDEAAHLIIDGFFTVRECADLTVYPTGSVVLRDGSEFINEQAYADPETRICVTLEGTPRHVEGGIFSESMKLYGAQSFAYCLFEAPQVLYAMENTGIDFWACEFRDNVILDAMDGSERLMVNFGGDAVMAEGKTVQIIRDPDADLELLCGENNVDIGGAAGLVIVSDETSAWINPGWLYLEEGESVSYTVNGVTVTHERMWDGEIGGGVSLRYEPLDEEELWRVFQVDGEEGTNIILTGKLEGFDGLRIMQGTVDISGLDTGDAGIDVSDMWESPQVNLGTHSADLWENDPENGGDRCGFGIIAEEGAEINVWGAVMLWDEERNDYGYATNVELRIGEKHYSLGPHIFGAKHGSGAVYLGVDDPAFEYKLIYRGEELSFEKECPVDGEAKTHLNPVEGKLWFEVSEDFDPELELIIITPEGVTVRFAHVPVKPDWHEPGE